MTQYQTAQQLTDQQLRETAGWMRISTKAYREPSPMQIFVSGLSYDIGRYSPVNAFSNVKLTGSTVPGSFAGDVCAFTFDSTKFPLSDRPGPLFGKLGSVSASMRNPVIPFTLVEIATEPDAPLGP